MLRSDRVDFVIGNVSDELRITHIHSNASLRRQNFDQCENGSPVGSRTIPDFGDDDVTMFGGWILAAHYR